MIAAVVIGVLVASAVWLVARPLVDGPHRNRLPRHKPRAAVVAALVALTVGAAVVMSRAEEPRPAAAVAPVAGSAASSAAPNGPASSGPSTPPDGTATPTDEQLAAVSAALSAVRTRPRDVTAHLDLARAYAGAGQAQLSTVEYLAVLRLDKANPEANTALALVALAAGRPTEGKQLVDTVLARHPRYPDALYTRGLIYLTGLRRVNPGVRDLRAYLAVAPYGSHRATVRTLLAMVPSGGTP